MKRILELLCNSKVIKNAGWIIGEQMFNMLANLVVGVLSARYLGPSNFGALNYTASFVTFFLSIATLGMEAVVIKKIIHHPDDEGIYLGSSLLFRLISSMFSTIAILIIVIILNPSEPIKWVLVILQSFQLLFKSVQILDAWFQRHLKSRYVSIGKMIACIVVSTYKVFLMVTQKNIVWFAVSNSLTDVIVAVMLYIFYKRENGQPLKVDSRKGFEILHESYHFILSGLMVAIYGQMDRIMIGSMLTDYDVGLYTTATAICGMWIFVPMAIINSFRPKIMELKKEGQEELYEKRLEQLYSGIIWLCIVVSAMVSFLAYFAVNLLFGKDYIGAVNALRIAIWYETFSMIGTARGIWILCENKNKYVKYLLGIGAAVNLVLNWMLIPVYGINGAAFATLVTEFVAAIVAPLFFRETRYHTLIVARAAVCHWYFSGRKEKTQS